MSQQSNFEKGVNYKATKSVATSGEAEKGEATKQQVNFKCDVTPAKGYSPHPGRQMNFPNGQ
jgi:hypothetical protein